MNSQLKIGTRIKIWWLQLKRKLCVHRLSEIEEYDGYNSVLYTIKKCDKCGEMVSIEEEYLGMWV